MNCFVWLGIAVVLAVIEAFTMGLSTIWFAGGAVVAAVAAFFGASELIQILIFLLVSGVLVIFTRPIAQKKLRVGKEKTNVDMVIGKTAVVTEEITPYQTGQVKLGGQEWTAMAEDEGVIQKGELVAVCAVEGVKLIVKKQKETGKVNG